MLFLSREKVNAWIVDPRPQQLWQSQVHFYDLLTRPHTWRCRTMHTERPRSFILSSVSRYHVLLMLRIWGDNSCGWTALSCRTHTSRAIHVVLWWWSVHSSAASTRRGSCCLVLVMVTQLQKAFPELILKLLFFHHSLTTTMEKV